MGKTEKMGDMLLKGAKMLSEHCPNCKSPLFQYEGNKVCAVCTPKQQTQQTQQTQKEAVQENTEEKIESDSKEQDRETKKGSQEQTLENICDTDKSSMSEQSGYIDKEILEKTGGKQNFNESLIRLANRLAKEMEQEKDLETIERKLEVFEKTIDIIKKI